MIPSRLEAVLITHPLVVDAGVVGIYSESESTEVPRAYIVPRGGLTAVSPEDRDSFARTIASWADQKVADHRRLRGGVALINEIPRSSTGKVLRKYLRSRANREVRAEAQE